MTYIPAQDRFLRESPEQSRALACQPSTTHSSGGINAIILNVFLAALNAEIKFRRYLEKTRLDPPETAPLPNDVLSLMRQTHELIEAIYWEAKLTKGSKGEIIIAETLAMRRRNRGRKRAHGRLRSVAYHFVFLLWTKYTHSIFFA